MPPSQRASKKRSSRFYKKFGTPMKRKSTRSKPKVRGSRKIPYSHRKDLEKMPPSKILESLKKIKDRDVDYLCLFDISHIPDFRRFMDSDVDCVPSVMQLIGIIDIYTANLLRILGVTMYQHEIVSIITLFAGYKLDTNPFKYLFKDVTSLIIDKTGQNLPSQSNELLKIGENQCVFMWIDFFDQGIRKSHCACLVRNTEGVLKVIDPQYDPRILIDQSIREIAAQFAIGRFYTRRE